VGARANAEARIARLEKELDDVYEQVDNMAEAFARQFSALVGIRASEPLHGMAHLRAIVAELQAVWDPDLAHRRRPVLRLVTDDVTE